MDVGMKVKESNIQSVPEAYQFAIEENIKLEDELAMAKRLGVQHSELDRIASAIEQNNRAIDRMHSR